MSGSWQDLKHGIRVLLRAPGFTFAALAVLSLGIGGNTAMFSIIHKTLLKPLPYRDPGRLVLGRCTFNGHVNPMASAPDYFDYREQADCFDGLSAVLFAAPKTTVTAGGEPERAASTFVAANLFRTLGVRPAAGRWFTAEEGRAGGPPVVMVSARLAKRLVGGARQAVGASLALGGRAQTVVGVMPATFRFMYDADVWTPMRRGQGPAALARRFHNWLFVGRLKPGVTLAGAQRQVDVISKRLEREYPDSNTHKALQLDPLQSALMGRQMPRLLVLMAAVGLVLLIACANVAGLLVARGSARRPELVVRMALGASRARITKQLLVESVVLALAAGALGVALAYWLSRLLPLVAGLSDPASASTGLEWPVALFALAISLVSGVFFGVAPALRASRLNMARHLAPGARTTGTKATATLRGALVAGQVAVSVVLLVGASLLIRSFAHLAGTEPGFTVQHVLTGEIQLLDAQYPEPAQRARFFEGLREDLDAVPGIEGAGFTSHLPVLNPGFNLAAWNADDPPPSPDNRPMAFRRVVLPGYFQALGIPLRAGRDFGAGDRENAPRTMVINERMAKTLFPGQNPIGRRVTVDMFSEPITFEVVGVVGDAHLEFIGEEVPMTMYLSYFQYPQTTMRLAVRSALDPGSVAQTVRRLIQARDHTIPMDSLVSMEQIMGESMAPQQATATLMALLAAFALLLASIGLYGALAYSVSERRREIGLRMALGARPRDVLGLVMGEGAVLASIGVAAGLAGAAGLTRLLAGLLFGVRTSDPFTFAAVPLGLIAVALVATYVPAQRAASVDPMAALRDE
jgi:putative ABC transport system permease protein